MEGTQVKVISIPALRLYHIRGLKGTIIKKEPVLGIYEPVYSVKIEGYEKPFIIKRQDLNFYQN